MTGEQGQTKYTIEKANVRLTKKQESFRMNFDSSYIQNWKKPFTKQADTVLRMAAAVLKMKTGKPANKIGGKNE